jgi:hypothetical protein
MTANRNRNAWLWVAIAAISLASVSRAEDGVQSAKAYAHPVLQFLASHSQYPVAKPAIARFAQRGSSVSSIFRDARTGTWMAMLPVFFIGLISPLSLLAAQPNQYRSQASAAPLLPSSFQRPPPHLV